MKRLILTTAVVLALVPAINAQQTQVLVENDQIKVEATKHPESCTTLAGGTPDLHDQDINRTCTELAITNKSRAPITAWVATTERERPGTSHKAASVGIRSSDSVAGSEKSNPWILPRDTHRVIMGNPARVDFKAAVFLDGSVFGDKEWVERIVQNRRHTYEDTAIALQKLRAAQKAGTTRERLIQEFRELEQQRGEQERENRHAPAGSPGWMLARAGIYESVSATLQMEQGASDQDALHRDIDRLESTLLEIGNRILVSRPPITDHPVSVGEPLDTPPAAGSTGR